LEDKNSGGGGRQDPNFILVGPGEFGCEMQPQLFMTDMAHHKIDVDVSTLHECLGAKYFCCFRIRIESYSGSGMVQYFQHVLTWTVLRIGNSIGACDLPFRLNSEECASSTHLPEIQIGRESCESRWWSAEFMWAVRGGSGGSGRGNMVEIRV
jgi:hypothetical protein